MNLLEELKSMGVDVEQGLDRLMGNVSLYERMLVKLLDMLKNSMVTPEFDSNNYDEIIEKAHAIKGATGNLSITPLYKAYSEVVSLLRENKPEQAKDILRKIQPVQTEIMNCIEKYV